ncbi:DUF3885 domain-containing protein [Streptomyces griseoaurantiacus]|uniref:DUF3885 domain-containing protein n=1 Tax=Streptomyces griseoaurantiacus TaxID=68213 RepID=UPI0026D5F675
MSVPMPVPVPKPSGRGRGLPPPRRRFCWWRGAGHHGRRFRPDDGYWQTLLVEDDPDPRFRTHCHLTVARRPWRHGCLDELLRDIADYKVGGVLITDTRLRYIYDPYDGGADVFLPTPGERDRMRDRHADWLSSHPSGL